MQPLFPITKLTITRLRMLADEEGEAAAVEQMAELLNAITGLIEHVAGHDRLAEEVGKRG
jgi:Asp-tRNA(Asn)/Glu-tRNA(Gln) amidotransferase C subunit